MNVAARLEALAEPGGICVSGTVVDAVGIMHDGGPVKLDAEWQDIGEQEMKNIARPIRVFRWMGSPSGFSKVESTSAASPGLEKPSLAVMPFVNISGDSEQGLLRRRSDRGYHHHALLLSLVSGDCT